MKLNETVIFESIEEETVRGSFGEPYVVANIKVGDQSLSVVFGQQIPEDYKQLSKIQQAFRNGEQNVSAGISVGGFVNIGVIGAMSAQEQTRVPLGSFLDVDAPQ